MTDSISTAQRTVQVRVLPAGLFPGLLSAALAARVNIVARLVTLRH